MGFSAVTFADGQSTDVVSPGTPSFVLVAQVDNKKWNCDIQLPVQDADGSDLTGLTKLVVATAVMTDGVNPFVGLSMDEILASGVSFSETALTPADAGTVKSVEVGLQNLGGFQAFAAAVSDI